MHWQTSKRQIQIDRPLVMGILNVTPDSFSDGGDHLSLDAALRQAEKMIDEGADILDIGGESTRPGGSQISAEEEIERIATVVEAVNERFDIPISIDTYKSGVAREAIRAGAEIINDISGLRFDSELATVTAEHGTGLVLMHSRGDFETMHSQPPVYDIFEEVVEGLQNSIEKARITGVKDDQIAVDIGIGFGKTSEQNLELIAGLDRVIEHFIGFPVMVGASRKSFIGNVLNNIPAVERVEGSIAAAVIAVCNGANIIRVHDVRQTRDALRVTEAILAKRNKKITE
ncbi:MAG: dihydropteroate synthase [Acidobacteria bacterium]|nr:dihydropteroate synthase [Acidobacteriota bacterium]